jgi:cytidylate kinase
MPESHPHIFKIAIDGHSSCGKSTLAKDLATALNFIYVDSGAMYRAVSLYILENKVDFSDPQILKKALEQIHIDFNKSEFGNRTILNGKDVEDRIRTNEVADIVSDVAKIPKVREKMVAIQRKLGENHCIVMDGRDIGTVVFPDADIKIFLTASIAVRTERRYLELIAKGLHVSRNTVAENLQKRDLIDSTREHSPLKIASEATVIDNSFLDRNQQLAMVLDLVKDKQTQIKKGGF